MEHSGGSADTPTLGIDLAADARATGVALIDWSDGPRVTHVRVGAGDDDLVALAERAGTIGIDCPLGWPVEFVRFVTRHAAHEATDAAETVADRRPLAYRRTDRWVAEHVPPLRPMSVSADRIAHVAFRMAGLLPRLDPHADRSGHGRVAEVYPAGSLLRWQLPFREYKGTDGRTARHEIADAIATVVHLDDSARATITTHADALDAVVAALAARAVDLGHATFPDDDDLARARVEGWILLPTCSLRELAC